ITVAADMAAASSANPYVRHGKSGGRDVAFVFFPAGCPSVTLAFAEEIFPAGKVKDLFSGKTLVMKKTGGARKLRLSAGKFRMAILTEWTDIKTR
ncbi:MAG: hypothetical protein WC076_02020, partial [Terrimicrobiaceae bacterium]